MKKRFRINGENVPPDFKGFWIPFEIQEILESYAYFLTEETLNLFYRREYQ